LHPLLRTTEAILPNTLKSMAFQNLATSGS